MGRMIEMQPVSRRDLLRYAGTGALAAVAASLFPDLASADEKAVMDSIMKKIGDKKPGLGRITLELPQIAENGATVPVAFEVDSPMTDKDYVKALHIFAEKNPLPDVVTIRFTPGNGRAKASTRMRLAKTQNVVAVAEMSDGTVYMAKNNVKVTIGGCGG